MKRKRLAPGPVSTLFRQLSDALRAGLPLRDTLAILARDSDLDRAQARLIAHLNAHLETGGTLSSALEAYPDTFPPQAIALIGSAEQEGALAEAIDVVATDYELRAMQRAGVKGALAWPAAIAVVLLLMIAVIMIFVIPAFKQVFISFGADLPGPTLLVMAVSDVVVEYFIAWIVVLGLAAGWVIRFGFPRVAILDRALIRVPFLRAFLVKNFLSRLSHVLAAAAENRLPLAPALAYLAATAGNLRLASLASQLQSEVVGGKDLISAVRNTPQMPGQLAVALELGTRANNLGVALRQVVALSEGEAARSLMRLQQATLILMYVCLGLVVGFVVIALYLPIFKLGAAI